MSGRTEGGKGEGTHAGSLSDKRAQGLQPPVLITGAGAERDWALPGLTSTEPYSPIGFKIVFELQRAQKRRDSGCDADSYKALH